MHPSPAAARRALIGPLAALCLAVPVLAGPGERARGEERGREGREKVEKA